MEYNNEEYPRLTPPTVVYEGKAALKKPAVIPLWVKTCAAAASVALLVALFFRHPARTELELMAELSPIRSTVIENEASLNTTGQRAHFVIPKRQTVQSSRERDELPMIAALEPTEAPALQVIAPSNDLVPGYYDPSLTIVDQPLAWDDDEEQSMLKRGFLRMTDGKYDSFGDMILSGWRSMKQEMSEFNSSVSETIVALKQTSNF